MGTNYDGGVTESSLPMSGGHLEIRKHLVGFDTKPLGKDSREPIPLRLERGEGLIGNEPCSLRLLVGGGCSQGEDDEISEVTDSTLSEQDMMDILFEAGYTTEEMKGIIEGRVQNTEPENTVLITESEALESEEEGESAFDLLKESENIFLGQPVISDYNGKW